MPVNAARCPYCPYHIQARALWGGGREADAPFPLATSARLLLYFTRMVHARHYLTNPDLPSSSGPASLSCGDLPSPSQSPPQHTQSPIPTVLPASAAERVQQAEAHAAQRVCGDQHQDRLPAGHAARSAGRAPPPGSPCAFPAAPPWASPLVFPLLGTLRAGHAAEGMGSLGCGQRPAPCWRLRAPR